MPTFFKRHITTEFILETENETLDLGRDYPAFESRGNAVTFQQTKKLTDKRTDKLSLQWNFRYGHFRADRFDDEGHRELFAVLGDELPEPGHQLCALGRWHARPWPLVKRLAGRLK